jgi:hypothetical protein
MGAGIAEPRAGGRFGFTMFDGKGRVDITFRSRQRRSRHGPIHIA